MCAKFEGNAITCLCFIAVFFKCANGRKKGRKNPKENEQLFEGLYLRNSWHDLLQIWYVFSPDMPALAQQLLVLFDKENTELRTRVKLCYVLCVNILTLCLFSWAA